LDPPDGGRRIARPVREPTGGPRGGIAEAGRGQGSASRSRAARGAGGRADHGADGDTNGTGCLCPGRFLAWVVTFVPRAVPPATPPSSAWCSPGEAGAQKGVNMGFAPEQLPPQTESSRGMTTIRCRDTVILTTDFDSSVNELRTSRAAFQALLHVT